MATSGDPQGKDTPTAAPPPAYSPTRSAETVDQFQPSSSGSGISKSTMSGSRRGPEDNFEEYDGFEGMSSDSTRDIVTVKRENTTSYSGFDSPPVVLEENILKNSSVSSSGSNTGQTKALGELFSSEAQSLGLAARRAAASSQKSTEDHLSEAGINVFTKPGKAKASARWNMAFKTVKRQAMVVQGFRSHHDEISVTAMNLSDGVKPLKALIKALKKAKAPEMTVITHSDLANGEDTCVERFLTDDLLVIDYGSQWGKYTDLSFRVGLRHSEAEDHSKSKKSILLFQAESMDSFETSGGSYVIKHHKSTSSRIPYVKSGKNLMVLYKSDDESKSDSGSVGNWIPLDEFFNNVILAVTRMKNRRSFTGDVGIHKLQSMFDSKLKAAANKQNSKKERRNMLQAVQTFMTENDILFTESNLAALLKNYRDVDEYDDMIGLIRKRRGQFEANAIEHGLSAEVQYYYAVALNARKKSGDVEEAERIVLAVCEREPNYMLAQGLKGKMFKKKFVDALQNQSGENRDEIWATWKLAVQAYTKLSELERADPNVIPSWSFSNLTVLLFAGEDPEHSKFSIWQSTDTLTQMLAGDLEKKTLSFWDSATLLSMDVISAYLFQNPLLFTHANAVVAHLMTFHTENWMLETMLHDLRFIHNVHQRRAIENSRSTSIEESRFNYWVTFLESSVGKTSADGKGSQKQLVLVSNAKTMGLEDYSKMSKMYISLEEDQSSNWSHTGPRSTSVDTPRSPRLTGARPVLNVDSQVNRVLSSTFGETRSTYFGGPVANTSSRLQPGVSDKSHEATYIVQISPAISGDNARQIEAPLKLVDIQNSDIPKPNQPGVLDERRIIISSSANETGINEIFTVIFPSSSERAAFWELIESHGYSMEKEMAELKCPNYYFIGSAGSENDKVVLGEGSFATVYLGAIDNPEEGHRLIAIKQMKEEFLTVPHAMADFLSEISKLNAMKHQNIIEFLGAEKVNGVLNTYLMELIDGGSLSQMVDVFGSLFVGKKLEQSMQAISAYTAQIVNGVQYLHKRHSICHRDVKPANALVHSQTGKVKLTDFGTVKDIGGLESTSFDLVGSLIYADPQVLMGAEYGLEVDIYSIGSTAWELATGRIPYHGVGGMDAVMQLRTANPGKMLPFNDEWPAELKLFLTKCWSPKNTRPDASELLKDKFIINGLDVANQFWTQPPSGLSAHDDISNHLSDLMRDREEHIVEQWRNVLSKSGSDGALAEQYKEEMLSLLEFIGDKLDSDVKGDSTRLVEVGDRLAELLADGRAPEELFTRARDFVVILRHLQLPKPPVTPEGSIEAREDTHFLMAEIKETDYFSRMPHTVWVCEQCLNETISDIIKDILPAASKTSRNREPPLDDGADRMDSSTARMILDKLDDVLDRLEPPHRSSRTAVSPSPELKSFLKEKGVGDQHAKILALQEITPAILSRQPPVLTRQELVDLGVPLGVAAVLLS